MDLDKWICPCNHLNMLILLCNNLSPILTSLMIGFMGTTAFLSMWISNSASTAMMLSIANAVLQQLRDTEANAEERTYGLRRAKDGQVNQAFEMGDSMEHNHKEIKSEDGSVTVGVWMHDSLFYLYWYIYINGFMALHIQKQKRTTAALRNLKETILV